ncbi:MAG: hypothetical protein PHQ12_07465 [Chthoniobacteraceae bacterium]|nr:hypothetical protein [Chthoniobacteraceae bacterium]
MKLSPVTPDPTPPKLGRPTIEATAADTQIHLRVTRRRKSAYVRAAKPSTLAAWCFLHLDKAAGYTEEPPAPPPPR